MERRNAVAIVLASSLMLAGCLVRTSGPPPKSFVQVNPPPRSMHPRAVESVAVLRDREPPAPYVDVAWMSVAQADVSLGLRQLRHNAAVRGCDALKIQGLDGATRIRTVESFDYQHTTHEYVTEIRGSCIVYRTAPGTWAPPPRLGSCARWRYEMGALVNPEARRRHAKRMPTGCASRPRD